MTKKKVIEEDDKSIGSPKESGIIILLEILKDKVKNRIYSKDELVREIEMVIEGVK